MDSSVKVEPFLNPSKVRIFVRNLNSVIVNYISLQQTPEELTQWLLKKGWLSSKEGPVLAIDRAGEGNMNVVLRAKTADRTFILKQSRPYVEKYQQIPAPLERIAVEHRFYQEIHGSAHQKNFPKVLAYDTEDHLLMMEDLGICEDMSYCYQGRAITAHQISKLIQIAKIIHSAPVNSDFPKNLELRKLNHTHIFELPFMEDNGFSLDEVQQGLQALTEPYKQDKELKGKMQELGERYLSTGEVLVHGDYYPGSWMSYEDQVFVIDPEFCFVGFAEFDLGVMAAHLTMATLAFGNIDGIFKGYGKPLDYKLYKQLVGAEILRRLIGLAQLPLTRTLNEKAYLLKEARNMVFTP